MTIPDGHGGALIVPAGCDAVPGPDGVLIARPHVADGGPPRIGDSVWRSADSHALPPVDGSAYPPDAEPVPVEPDADGPTPSDALNAAIDADAADGAGPFVDTPPVVADVTDMTDLPESSKTTTVAPPDEPATPKRRRGGSAA